MATKKCPQCAEQVKADAKVCRFCNFNFLEKPKKRQPQTPGEVGCTLLLALALLGGMYLMLSRCSSDVPGNSSSTQNQSVADDAARKELMATFINLSGNLCAKVVYVSQELSTGERQVNCEEYRDPRKSGTKQNMVVYMVSIDAQTVRLMGRT